MIWMTGQVKLMTTLFKKIEAPKSDILSEIRRNDKSRNTDVNALYYQSRPNVFFLL